MGIAETITKECLGKGAMIVELYVPVSVFDQILNNTFDVDEVD